MRFFAIGLALLGFVLLFVEHTNGYVGVDSSLASRDNPILKFHRMRVFCGTATTARDSAHMDIYRIREGWAESPNATCVTPANSCWRHGCHNTTGVYVCNTNAQAISLRCFDPDFENAGDHSVYNLAWGISMNCCQHVAGLSGEQDTDAGFRVIVAWANCDHKPDADYPDLDMTHNDRPYGPIGVCDYFMPNHTSYGYTPISDRELQDADDFDGRHDVDSKASLAPRATKDNGYTLTHLDCGQFATGDRNIVQELMAQLPPAGTLCTTATKAYRRIACLKNTGLYVHNNQAHEVNLDCQKDVAAQAQTIAGSCCHLQGDSPDAVSGQQFTDQDWSVVIAHADCSTDPFMDEPVEGPSEFGSCQRHDWDGFRKTRDIVSEDEHSVSIVPRADPVRTSLNCGIFNTGDRNEVNNLLSHIEALSTPCVVAANDCHRFGCSGTTGIYICNDNDNDISLSCKNEVAYMARYVGNECCTGAPKGQSGQQFTDQNWNAIIAYANCNHGEDADRPAIGLADDPWGPNGECKAGDKKRNADMTIGGTGPSTSQTTRSGPAPLMAKRHAKEDHDSDSDIRRTAVDNKNDTDGMALLQAGQETGLGLPPPNPLKLDCGTDATADRDDSWANIAYLLSNTAGNNRDNWCVTPPHKCWRHACWETSGLYVCNHNDYDLALKCSAPDRIVDFARKIMFGCCIPGGGGPLSGLQSTDQNYTVAIGYANCNHHPNEGRPGYGPWDGDGPWGQNHQGDCKFPS
ncbi:hypothetical protein B0T17DRAFT_620074 [Bombardia bombarda]|uniref:Uncharacterized protein n=1 Tax=Bombardia bombarda TaxID=252184 RepID=A0AA39WH44_9PEZI|nr:hypothetical protein B0T17DRAFT_620074 [Bombardia bombarda]